MCNRLKKACRECPFKRNSAPGYLGTESYQPELFIAPYWVGPAKPPCHMRVDYERDDIANQIRNAPVCFGFATICKNTAKLPINTAAADMVRSIEPNTDHFFANIQEFIKYHSDNK